MFAVHTNKVIRTITVRATNRSANLEAFCSRQRQVRYNRTSASASSKKVKDVSASDKRYQSIRDMLYSRDVPTTMRRPIPPTTAKSFADSVADPSTNPEAAKRDAIERAWALLKQREAVEKIKELRGMYQSMREAMEELEKTDTRLFEAAKVGASKEEVVVFPRRLRVPTETPPVSGWEYQMKTDNR